MDKPGPWVGVPSLREELSELDLVAEERTADVDALGTNHNDTLT